MDGLIQDIRYAARKLSRQPGFTLAALITLALGIGANAVLFTLINSVLLRPTLGVSAPEQLVTLYTSDYSSGPYGASSYADYEDFAEATDVFVGAAAYSSQVIMSGPTDQPTRVGVELVSPSYFPLLGVPLRGRSFSGEEAATGALVTIVSHHYWQTQMGAASDAVGRTIQLNAQPVTVIGIGAEGFRGSQRGFGADVWLPMRTAELLGAGAINTTSRGDRGLSVIARLQPGTSIDRAQQRMNVVAGQLFEEFPQMWNRLDGTGRNIAVLSERASRVPAQARTQAYAFTGLLSVVVALVLLICCANVAGLMVARASGLTREMGIRISIGASRARIARLLFVESAVLATAAALIGLFATMWLGEIASGVLPRLPFPIALDFSIDHRVILFTSGVALFAAILFGTAPALRASRSDPNTVIKGGVSQVLVGKHRVSFRSMLVAAQVAASVVLLVTALLFVRSMKSALQTDLGFDSDNIAIMELEAEPGYSPSDEEGSRAALAAMEILESTPGVVRATWANVPPFGMGASRRGIRVEGHESQPGEDMEYNFTVAGPAFFETIGIPLVRGRDLTPQDRDGAQRVVIVNEAFAARFWPGNDAVGKRVMLDGENYATVIGVARDARLLDVGNGAIKPHMFMPALQSGWWGATIHARVDNLTPAALKAMKEALDRGSPRWSVRGEHTMAAQVAGSILPQRIASVVLAMFGTLALFLSAIGLYGVIAYAVAQRTHELGIRFALGATTRDVLQLMLGQGLRVIIAGAVVGMMIAAAGAQLLEALLLGMSPLDPISFIAAPVILALIGVAATLLPAHRASRLDPLTALRSE